MTLAEAQIASAPEPTAPDATRRSKCLANFIDDERQWRLRPQNFGLIPSGPRIVATRWRSLEHRAREVHAETPADSHVVAIVLRNENVLFSVSGRTVHDGVAMPGTFHVTEPGARTRCLFRGPYDVLHFHVPNGLISEICRGIAAQETAGFGSQTTLARDTTAERLALALLAAERIAGSYGHVYADSVGIAIVARLLSLRQADLSDPPKVTELAKWRLKRAIEYIETSLAESVSLADIASAAGLTRMHFAAQFRAATGLRPHEYLLRRRIERAQEKLAGTDISLAEIALSVGFQTQSHFTSVFTRMVGQPPRAWRRARDSALSCDLGTSRACSEATQPIHTYTDPYGATEPRAQF
jgi:AraC family transcriptional regulator